MGSLVILVFLLIIYRLYQQREVIRQLTWWEGIYSTVLYVGLFMAMIYGYSIVKKWFSGIFENEIIELVVLFSYTGITIWIIVSILGKLLPEKIIQAIFKE